ncbi:MAG TPA: hypothetical protein VFX45_09820 [Solirubrobacterales bacterium]|nr:hypothetical protein [Solirubrobacterales bacterium]
MEKGNAGGSDEKQADGGKKGPDKRRLYGIIAAAGIVVVALILLLSSGGDDSADEPAAAAEVLSVEALGDAVSGQEPPVYWAGEQQGTEVELSQPEAGRTYIRYLTDGAEAGDERADFLTVGTYAHTEPVAALRKQGKEPGGVIATAPGGATVYFSRKQPHSVYLAYPGLEAEIEVYDPNFTRALQLVNSGQIVPVG